MKRELVLQLDLNKQQSGHLVVDAAVLGALLAACSAGLVALKVNQKPFMVLLFMEVGLTAVLLGLLLGNAFLEREGKLIVD